MKGEKKQAEYNAFLQETSGNITLENYQFVN